MSKKLLSLILSLCMILQVFCMLPAFASDEEVSTGAASGGMASKYFIDDQFETAGDTDGWAHGVVNEGYEGIVEQTTVGEGENAVGALKVSNEGIEGYNASNTDNGNQTVATKALTAPVTLDASTNVIIKTRVMHTSDSARFYMKFNRPDSLTRPSNECGGNLYTLFNVNKTSGIQYSSGVSGIQANIYQKIIGKGVANTWINVELKMYKSSSGTDMLDIKATLDGDETGTVYTATANLTQPSSVYQAEYGSDTTVTAFDILKSFAFTLRESTDTLYVDYVQGYVEYPLSVNNVTGSYVQYDGAFQLKLTSDGEIAVPDTAFYVTTAEGEYVATTPYFDEETGIYSLTPDESLTVGDKYILNVTDAEGAVKLAAGTTASYEIEAREARSNGTVFNDTFDNGTTDGWYLGAVNSEEQKGTLEVVDIEGEEGNKALKFSGVVKSTETDNGDQSTLTRKLGGGIEYEEGTSVVIKTRAMHTSSEARMLFLVNRPDSVKLPDKTLGYNRYVVFVANKANGIYLRSTQGKTEDNAQAHMLTTATVPDVTNKWVQYEIKIDGLTNKYTINGFVEETETAFTHTGLLEEPTTTYNYAYGANSGRTTFDALERLTFTLREANNEIWVDYVKVYEEMPATAAITSNTIYADESIELTVDTTADLTKLPQTAAALLDKNGDEVEAAVTVDAELKTITIDPTDDLSAGLDYTVKVNPDAFAEIGAAIEDTSFELNILSVNVMGNVVNQQFETAGDAEGWLAAPAREGYEAKLEQTTFDDKGVLKITASESMTTNDTSNDLSAAHYILPKEIFFREGGKIVLKTKFYHQHNEANTGGVTERAFFKYNRAWEIADRDQYEHGHNQQLLFGNNTDTFVAKTTTWGTAPSIQDGTTNVITSGIFNNWVEVEATLDFPNNSVEYVISVAGGDPVTQTGNLTTKYPQEALESLAVVFRGYNSSIYIDYLTVSEVAETTVAIDAKEVLGNANINAYIMGSAGRTADFSKLVKLKDAGGNIVEAEYSFTEEASRVRINPAESLAKGTYTVTFDKAGIEALGYVINGDTEFTFDVIDSVEVDDSFDDGDLSDWGFRNEYYEGQSAEIVEENGNKFLRVSFDGSYENCNDGEANEKSLVFSKKFSGGKFVRDMENYTVLEMKLRTNANNLRKYIKLNYPTEGTKETNLYGELLSNTRVAWSMNWGRTAGSFATTVGNSSVASTAAQGDALLVGDPYELDKWYTVKTIYDNAAGTASYYIYDENGELYASQENHELTAWWFRYSDAKKTQPQLMHTIEDISIQFRNVVTVEGEALDVDDIKLYNTNVKIPADVKAQLLDADGKEVTSLTEASKGITVIPTFTLKPENGKETTYTVISAKYVNGVLSGTPHINVITTTGIVYAETDGYEIDEINGVEIKAFIWNSLSGMAPAGVMAEAAGPQ